MLAEALESNQILNEKQLAFLADPGIPDGQAAQTTIPNTAAFQTEDLDAYDSDCDDVSKAKAVLMANLSNYGSNIISKYLQETQQSAVQDTNLYAQQDSMILSVIEQISEQMINHEKLALKQQIDSLKQNLSNQIREKESLLQTFTLFKNESKEKESKYMDKEIDLEKKIKELDNIVYKVGQSAQIVHIDIDFGGIIIEYMVKISKKARILELKRRPLKITILTSNTQYPSRKIRRICACTSLKTTKEQGSIRRIQRRPIRRIQFILVNVLLYAAYHSTGSSDTDQIASLVGSASDPWDQRVHSQLIGKDLVSRLLVYELPLSSLRKKYRLSLKNDMPPRDK
ncbi:hypothetical protein Tco_0031572 [Tanacetum coccineum]